MKIGIMSAMIEEIESLLKEIKIGRVSDSGARKYYEGTLWNIDVVLVFSRWGKVASSSTVTNLIINHKVDTVIFSGVAGAIDDSLNIGDIVIGNNLYQHDMDSRPLFKQFEIPLINKTAFSTDSNIRKKLETAAQNFVESNLFNTINKDEFNISVPKVMIGDIASGDKFVADANDALRIKNLLPSILCVEMEGAAVAQVCYEYMIPFAIIRTISDTADHDANINFTAFISKVASKYTREIIHHYFLLIS